MSKNTKNKFVFYLVLVLIIFLIYNFWNYISPHYYSLIDSMIEVISKYPVINGIFLNITENISNNTFLGLLYVFTFMTLFFIPAPIDIVFINYVRIGINTPMVIGSLILGSLIGFYFNYFFGLIFGEKILRKIIKGELFDKFTTWIEKYGSFLFSAALILPVLPSQVLSLLYGFSKFPLRKFSIIIIITMLVKLILMVLLMDHIVDVFNLA